MCHHRGSNQSQGRDEITQRKGSIRRELNKDRNLGDYQCLSGHKKTKSYELL